MKELAVVAFHEAGHAVAVRLRNGAVNAVTIDPGLTKYTMPQQRQGNAPKLFRNGVLVQELPAQPQPRALTEADAFIAYAGSWAEVRCRWNLALDTKDEHGHSFSTYVAAILRKNATDYATYEQAPKPADAESVWSSELERFWPVIQLIAKRLHAAHLDNRRRQARRRRWQARRRRHGPQVHT